MRIRQGMDKLIGTTIVLVVGLSVILTLSYRESVTASWDESRCKPGVVPIAALFKPATDPRTGVEFAKDNWAFCQKQYVQDALKIASTGVKGLAEAQSAVVDITSTVIDGISKTFTGLWSMCYQAYKMFMDRFMAAAKLMRNMMINMNAMVDRLQAVMFSVAMALISMIMAMINTIQVTLIAAVVIIGILLILQIFLFWLLAPISGLILTISALVMTTVVIAMTAVTAAMINDGCFAGDTKIVLASGAIKRIDEVRIGDVLEDLGTVTATHVFLREGPLYCLDGVHVSGTHLITTEGGLMPVKDVCDARLLHLRSNETTQVYCLTTSKRRIPVVGNTAILHFADWEEIPATDTESLQEWYRNVWHTLNGEWPESIPASIHSEAGFSPDCMFERRGLFKNEPVRATMLRLGDVLADGSRITGIVEIAGSEATVIKVGSLTLSPATWIFQDGIWQHMKGIPAPLQPGKLIHFYTDTGLIRIGGMTFRDASDVGLSDIERLVKDIVLA